VAASLLNRSLRFEDFQNEIYWAASRKPWCLSLYSFVTRRQQKERWMNWIIVGLTGDQCMLNCRQWRTFVKPAAVSMRWGEYLTIEYRSNIKPVLLLFYYSEPLHQNFLFLFFVLYPALLSSIEFLIALNPVLCFQLSTILIVFNLVLYCFDSRIILLWFWYFIVLNPVPYCFESRVLFIF